MKVSLISNNKSLTNYQVRLWPYRSVEDWSEGIYR